MIMNMSANILTSKIRYDPPAKDTNMAKELESAFQRYSNKSLLFGAKEQINLTGAKLLDQTSRVATGLISKTDLRVGDMVLLMTEHSVAEVLLAFSVTRAGGAFYGFMPDDGQMELLKICKLIKPKVIATHSWLHHWIVKLKEELSNLKEVPVIWIDNPALEANNNIHQSSNHLDKKVTLLEDLLNYSIDQELLTKVSEQEINNREHPFCCMLTSGSTGPPKAVPTSHWELVSCLYSMISASRYPLPNGGYLLPQRSDSVLSGDLPLDHGAGVYVLLMSICVGSKTVIMKSYDEEAFWKQVQVYGIISSISSTCLGYKLLRRLKTLINSGQAHTLDLSKFKVLSCAGSKLNFESLVHEVNQVYDFYVKQSYGCTEIGFISTLDLEHSRTHMNSVGHLLPGMTAKIVDRSTGQLLGPNQRGELYVNAESKFKRYLCQEGIDAHQMYLDCHDSEGFYKTGDEAHIDEEGRIYLHGRFKETLTLDQDWKIMPSELEELVDQHPLVEQSAVVGVHNPDLVNCDAPKAFVRLIPKVSSDKIECRELRKKFLADDFEYIAKHIYNYVAKLTPSPKHLKGGVRIVEDFPRNGLLQKIDRRALKLLD